MRDSYLEIEFSSLHSLGEVWELWMYQKCTLLVYSHEFNINDCKISMKKKSENQTDHLRK